MKGLSDLFRKIAEEKGFVTKKKLIVKTKPVSYNDIRKNFLYNLPCIGKQFEAKKDEFVLENGKLYKKYQIEEVTETYTAKRQYNRFLKNVLMQAVLGKKKEQKQTIESGIRRKTVREVRKTFKSNFIKTEGAKLTGDKEMRINSHIVTN